METTPKTYLLPDTLRNWPWDRIISPHYAAAQAESVAWLESFHPFTTQAQHAFNKCDFSLVSALTFPKASHYNLRSCCDLMHTFFTLDEYTDICDGPSAKVLCDATMDAITYPDKPRTEGESVIGEIAHSGSKPPVMFPNHVKKDLPLRGARTSARSSFRRSVVHRPTFAPSTNTWLLVRDNIGSDPSFALLEISLELDLPHEVMQHPAIVSLNRDTTDMIILANVGHIKLSRVYSVTLLTTCALTKRSDADYNAVTVIMVNNKTDLSGGIQWISDRHDEIVDHFLATREDVLNHRNGVPSWGEDIDRQVASYIDGLGQWIRGHDEWNFQSGRYFGNEGLEIQKSRMVVIA